MSGVNRRTCYTRRRTRSVGSIPFVWQPQNIQLQVHQTQSDDMCSSSTSKDKDYPAYYHSDSDDICSGEYGPCFSAVCSSIPNNRESNSFNENSPCLRSTRRKRKFKRIAIEIEISGNSRFCTQSYAAQSYSKKKRAMRHYLHCPSNRLWLNVGKRKRSAREKLRSSMDGESSDLGRDSKVLAISKLSLNDYPGERNDSMEVSYTVAGISSSSKLSSSGSETEVYTNDEGREGDDEQSDWVGDVGLAAGCSFNQTEHIDANKNEQTYSYHKYFHGNFGPTENRKTFKFFAEKVICFISNSYLCKCSVFEPPFQGNDTDVRSSRRKERPVKSNFTFVLPSNDKTSKFIPSFLDNTRSKNRMEKTGSSVSRRYTFSGHKKRKRLPASSIVTDASDKSSEIFISTVHKLSDISSSDSKDSVK